MSKLREILHIIIQNYSDGNGVRAHLEAMVEGEEEILKHYIAKEDVHRILDNNCFCQIKDRLKQTIGKLGGSNG